MRRAAMHLRRVGLPAKHVFDLLMLDGFRIVRRRKDCASTQGITRWRRSELNTGLGLGLPLCSFARHLHGSTISS
jgi:hypothetical protein